MLVTLRDAYGNPSDKLTRRQVDIRATGPELVSFSPTVSNRFRCAQVTPTQMQLLIHHVVKTHLVSMPQKPRIQMNIHYMRSSERQGRRDKHGSVHGPDLCSCMQGESWEGSQLEMYDSD